MRADGYTEEDIAMMLGLKTQETEVPKSEEKDVISEGSSSNSSHDYGSDVINLRSKSHNSSARKRKDRPVEKKKTLE